MGQDKTRPDFDGQPLGAGMHSKHAFWSQCNTRTVSWQTILQLDPTGHSCLNLNHPADYARALELLGRGIEGA